MRFRSRKAQNFKSSAAAAPAVTVKPRARHARRALARVAVYGVLALVALVLFVLLYPWSLPALDRRLQERWLAATGLTLTYERARINLSRGRINIEQPALTDPASGQRLLELDRVRIEMPIGQFFFSNPPYTINNIDLHGLIPLVLSRERDKFALSPPWDRIAEVVRKRRQQIEEEEAGKPAKTQWVVLRHLRASFVDLRLYEKRAGRRASLLQVNNAAVEADFGHSLKPQNILIAGQLSEHDRPNAIKLQVRPDFARQAVGFNLALDRLDTMKDLPWPSPINFQSTGLEIVGQVSRQDRARWSVRGYATLNRIELLGADGLQDQSLGQARLVWDFLVNPQARQVELSRLGLTSKVCTLESSGSLVAQAPYPYTLEVRPLKIEGPGIKLIASGMGKTEEIVRPSEASLHLEARIQGELAQKMPDSIVGRIQLAGLNLLPQALPPLSNIQLAAELTSQTLKIKDARGFVQGMPVAIQGSITGPRPLAGEIRTADLNWQANGSLKDLTALIHEQTSRRPLPLVRLSGLIAGQGRVRVTEPLQGTIQSLLERMRLEGSLELNRVTLSHPRLAEPVRNLEGEITFSSRTARLKRLSGEWLGGKFKASGKVEGAPQFWRQPTVTLKAQVSGVDIQQTLRRIGESSPTLKAALAKWPETTGKASLDLQLAADPRAWQRAKFSGALDLRNFTTTILSENVFGPVALDRARLTFDESRLGITELSGKWGEVDIRGTGDLRNDGGAVNLTLDGALKEIGEMVPLLSVFFRVDGTARIDNAWSVRTRQGFRPPESWMGWWAYLREHKPKDGELRRWIGERWETDGHGTLNVRDAEMTFVTMPARLREITGRFNYDNERLWSPKPLPVKGGENSRNTMGSIELIFGKTLNDFLQDKPLRTTVFNFSVMGEYMDTDEWIRMWDLSIFQGRHSKENPLVYDPTHQPSFRLHGDFNAEAAYFRGIYGQNFRAQIDLDHHVEQSDRFRWHDISADIYGGKVKVSGVRVKREVDVDVAMEKVGLEPMVKAIAGKPNVHGLFSGVLTGNVHIHRPNDDLEPVQPLTGKGELSIQNSRFVSNAILRSLGGLLKLPVFEEITFSTIQGPFRIEGKQFVADGIVFRNPIVSLNMRGTIGPERKLKLKLRLEFLSIVGRVPLVGEALDLVNKLTGKVFNVQVLGTTDKPRVLPL